jgi:YidC/Oxa1 family membrane protein insertase
MAIPGRGGQENCGLFNDKMSELLYTIIIFPLVQIIEISFVIVYRIFNDKAVAIIGVSAVVTLCTMPLYFVAEKWQQIERDTYKKLKPKVDKIKSVFKGDEQYMILSAYYRQNHYHPLYTLRNSLGVLIQVPFFIAAYSWLSHLELIKGVSFLFISDMGAPDGSLSLGGLSVNILPILMTAINCASGAVYTKGLPNRDKIQVYGIALVFLVLLYNSPAGLVLYWTMNNIFSLAKNILSKLKHGLKIVYVFLCLCALVVIIRYAFLGFTTNRLAIAGFCTMIFFAPIIIRLFQLVKNNIFKIATLEESAVAVNSTYFLSVLILFVLSGLVIPSALIASSVQEFSFLDPYTTPLPFIRMVLLQSMGIFLFWPLCIYFLFSKKIKYGLSLVLSLVGVSALLSTFLFPGNYGVLTPTFRFTDPETLSSSYRSIIVSSMATLSILGGFTVLLFSKRKFIFHSFQLIVLCTLVIFGIINIHKINTDFTHYENIIKGESGNALSGNNPEPVYHLSKGGKNVVVFMLDAAISGYIPYIFEEKPELYSDFSGFTHYPNCVSLGHHTRVGMPLIFGGYEYEPRNVQKGRAYAMGKHNEALLMMPRIFLNNDYKITVTDPTFANYSWKPDLSVFAPYPEISVQNTQGNYTGNWLRSHSELPIVSVPKLLKELLIRFSFQKIVPQALKVLMYDNARWLKAGIDPANQFSLTVLDSYSTLDYLPLLTEITDASVNTYTAIVNDLTHDHALYQYPDYVPAINITDTGNGPFAKEAPYHSNMAALLLMGKWLRFLQEQGVYDNTRIIIVSDHGKSVGANYNGNIRLPNGHRLSHYHALLLVKDFDAHGDIVTDTTFMTNGDVPLFAMEGLIDNPQNPFTGNSITSDKETGVFIVTATVQKYSIANDQWLHVHDNVFNPDNWKKVKR